MTISPVRGEGRPTLVGVSKTARDIQARKRAEETLRASEARFRALVENSWDGVTLIDGTGTIQYTTPATTRILGYPLAEYIGQNGMELVHPDDQLETREAFARVADLPSQTVTCTHRIRHRDGSWRWVETAVTNLLVDSDVRALVLNSRDVTDTREANEALRHSEERFRAFMDHTPATAFIKDEDEPLPVCPTRPGDDSSTRNPSTGRGRPMTLSGRALAARPLPGQ